MSLVLDWFYTSMGYLATLPIPIHYMSIAMIDVTVVLHEIDGYQVEVSQKSILSEGFAPQCAQNALQTYNNGIGDYYCFQPATDAKVYNSVGSLIANVTR
jgi:hypothetical protein